MRQVEGIDYTQTFSLVVKSISVRLVLTIAVSRGWKLKQIGILRLKCFFLHGTLEERIVLSQPVGFIDKERPNDVCLIKRALYGLKRSSRMWYKRLKEFLLKIGCKPLRKVSQILSSSSYSKVMTQSFFLHMWMILF